MKSDTLSVAGMVLTGLLVAALAPVTHPALPPAADAYTITELPFVIEEPGAYALGGNLSGRYGIVIAADGVTLDLRGYVLTGLEGSFEAIKVRDGHTAIEIFGGTVSGWNSHGIAAGGATSAIFRELRLVGNGGNGLQAGHGAVVENVIAEGNGATGIQALGALTVSGSMAGRNLGWGYELGAGSVLQGSTVMRNGAGGVLAADGSLVRDNVVRANGWLAVPSDAAACDAGTLAGIAVTGAGTLVERNTVTDNGIGLQLLSAGNTVVGNLVRGNALQYEFVEGNQLDLMLAELPQRILWPAKVTLTGSLEGTRGYIGLEIDADDVTVDLGGHALIGVPGTSCGIMVRPGHAGIRVQNGFLNGWEGCGLYAEHASDLWIEDLTACDNGKIGLCVGDGSHVVNCIANGNAKDGLAVGQDAVVDACSVNGNGNDGLHVGPHSTVTAVTASENGQYGIHASEGTSVLGSTASKNMLGISVSDGCLVQHCTMSFNDYSGLRAENACMLIGNMADGNANGLVVMGGPGSRVEGNNLTRNLIGLNVIGAGNLVIGNTCLGNQKPYSIAPNNTYGPFVDVSAGGALGDIGPWTNFLD